MRTYYIRCSVYNAYYCCINHKVLDLHVVGRGSGIFIRMCIKVTTTQSEH